MGISTDAFMKVPSFGALEAVDCGLCGSATFSQVTMQHWFGEDFRVVRCAGCGLIRTNPRPTEEWKSRFYDPTFNGFAEANGRDFFYAPDETRLPGYRMLLAHLKKHAPKGAKLLDVGCAAGLFVREAKLHGYDAYGCDYSQQAVDYGREHLGVEIIRSPAEAINAPNDSYDVVTLLHVFEHLPNPMQVLGELRRVLRPGGLLFLETVNYQPHYQIEKHFRFLIGPYNRLTRRPGLPWVPFDHLYHWSPDALSRAMTESGFKDVRLPHLRGYRSEQKPDGRFRVVYAMCEAAAGFVTAVSGGKCNLWPVLLATGRK